MSSAFFVSSSLLEALTLVSSVDFDLKYRGSSFSVSSSEVSSSSESKSFGRTRSRFSWPAPFLISFIFEEMLDLFSLSFVGAGSLAVFLEG